MNRSVAWSKTGTIASISADGEALEFRFLRCIPDTGHWDLSEPTTCELVRGTPTIPLVHLEWSTTSLSELAVIDAAGRVHLMSFSISLNRSFTTRNWENDSVDDINSVVGCHWLATAPANQPVRCPKKYGLPALLTQTRNLTMSCMDLQPSTPIIIHTRAHLCRAAGLTIRIQPKAHFSVSQ